jgi:hypothetical protein
MIAAPLRATSRAVASPPTPPAQADAVDSEAQIESEIAELLAHAPTPEEQALARQAQAFDFVAKVQAENEREMNALREASMKQIAADDEILKKWIELI